MVVGLDVTTAYLYGNLDHKIYLRTPQGLVITKEEYKYALQLNKSIYELQVSGKELV